MTIRRMTHILLLSTTIFSAALMALFLTVLTDAAQREITLEEYDNTIIEFQMMVSSILEEDPEYLPTIFPLLVRQPIQRAVVFDLKGEVLAEEHDNRVHIIENGQEFLHVGPNAPPMVPNDQIDSFTYTLTSQEDEPLGTLVVERRILARVPFFNRVFDSSLFKNFLIALIPAFMVSILLGFWFSKTLSRSLKGTAVYAQNLQQGRGAISIDDISTSIAEISTIQDSLVNLDNRLKIKQKSRKTLIDNMVHQTRTPLTILKSHLEGIEDGIMNLDADELKILYTQIDNITEVIANMSGMIDAAKEIVDLSIEEISIPALLQKVSAGFSSQFSKKDLALSVQQDPPITIISDRFLLSQILYNLLSNAQKYSNAEGEVSIRYTKKEDSLLIRISDTGIGIRKERLPNIFDAYYRAYSSQEVNGEGLGLFIVKENMILLDGTISVESDEGIGTVFTLELPLVREIDP